MAEQIRFTEYATLPPFDVAHGVALGIAVLSAVPQGATGPLSTAAASVRSSVVALQDSWRTSRANDAAKSIDPREIDTRVDHAWSRLAQALDATRGLRPSTRQEKAAALHDKLFSGGLSFLQLKYAAQWAECKLRLDTIDKDGLGPDIDSAAGGPEFLEEVRAAQVAYGEVLGIDQAPERVATVNLSSRLGELRVALESYVGELIAWSRRSPENYAPARLALAAIDRRRAAAGRARGSEPAPDVTPETPVPEVPAPSPGA